MQADAASAFARAAPIRPQAYAVSPPAQPSAPKGRPPAIGDTRRGRLGPREQFLAVPDMAPHSVGIPAPPSAAEPAPRAAEPAPASPPPLPDRSTWERIALAPDLELHVRRPLSRIQNKLLERLLELARKLFEEELP
jgi:hypothetical protein